MGQREASRPERNTVGWCLLTAWMNAVSTFGQSADGSSREAAPTGASAHPSGSATAPNAVGEVEGQPGPPRAWRALLAPLSLPEDDKQQQYIKEAFHHFASLHIPNTDYYLCQSSYNDQWISEMNNL